MSDPGTVVYHLDGVRKTYPGPPPVAALRGCSIEIGSGEMVAVTGTSGSGKSTLLNLLGLLDTRTGGTLLLGGQDPDVLPDRERTRLRGAAIGFVFQDFQLLGQRAAWENVAVPLVYAGVRRAARRRVAEQALERVGLAHRVEAPAGTLSGGEKQRVAIARALVPDPSVLLCDEPTGNLDTRTSEQIVDLLCRLHGEGLTIVVVTHDPDVASRAPRVLRVADGEVREA